MQKLQFPIAFDAPEFLLRFQQARGCPAQGLLSFSPAFHVARYALDGREARLDRISRGQRAAQQPAHAQAMYRQRFLHAFLQTPCRAGVDAFQLPEDFPELRLRAISKAITGSTPAPASSSKSTRTRPITSSTPFIFSICAPTSGTSTSLLLTKPTKLSRASSWNAAFASAAKSSISTNCS